MSTETSRELFSVPRRTIPQTPVEDADADAFVQAPTPAPRKEARKGAARVELDAVSSSRPATRTAMARLSVDVPCASLHALKVRAVTEGRTVRELVLAMLAREGL